MNKAMHEVLAMPDVKAAIRQRSASWRKPSTPGELMERLKADINKWDEVIAKADIPKK